MQHDHVAAGLDPFDAGSVGAWLHGPHTPVVLLAMFLFCGWVVITGVGHSSTVTVMVLLFALTAGVQPLTFTQ